MTPKLKIGYIPNARDFTGADPIRKAKRNDNDMQMLRELGLEVELLDLQEYFGKVVELKDKVAALGAIFISGGNVFVLRQAMKLSGLDAILIELRNSGQDFLYAGYSAAGCVLSPKLDAYQLVDPLDAPYKEQQEIIMEGLGFIDFAFVPHWKSDHAESADIDKVVEYCEGNNIPFRGVRDGEVLVL